MPIAVIIGAGKGIGFELTQELLQRKIDVIAISKNIDQLNSLKVNSSNHLTTISCDITDAQQRKPLFNIIKDKKIDYLIHNAAIVTPVSFIDKVSEKELRNTFETNFFALLLLTNLLLPLLKKNSRILVVSSGAAERPKEGILAYSISKAALKAWAKGIGNEQKDIAIATVDPGMVDTDMQKILRESPIDIFPLASKLKEAKETSKLISPKKCAKFLTGLLLDTSLDYFKSKDWNESDYAEIEKIVENNTKKLMYGTNHFILMPKKIDITKNDFENTQLKCKL